VAVVNGTSALHIALKLAGVAADSEVITQALTFVATCNALSYLSATPVFVDVDRGTLGMCPAALRRFLDTHTERRDDSIWNKTSGRRIAACVPMHTFGHPCRIDEIAAICAEYGLPLVEDSAESLGSYGGIVRELLPRAAYRYLWADGRPEFQWQQDNYHWRRRYDHYQ